MWPRRLCNSVRTSRLTQTRGRRRPPLHLHTLHSLVCFFSALEARWHHVTALGLGVTGQRAALGARGNIVTWQNRHSLLELVR